MSDSENFSGADIDYRRCAILYVDDEEQSLKYFTRVFRKKFRVFTASSAAEGFRLFEKHVDDLGVLITDERMPGEKGVRLLERVRELKPTAVRILVTAYSDLDAAIRAVNSGSIFKYVSKPWDIREFEMIIRGALSLYVVQAERDNLMREKLAHIHRMMTTDRVITLGVAAAGLGHYVRNSLVAVRTFLDLAPARLKEELDNERELRNPSFWSEFYQHVQSQVDRISKLLSGLGLVYDGIDSPPSDEVQLGAMMREVSASIEREMSAKDIQSVVRISHDLPTIVADRKKTSAIVRTVVAGPDYNAAGRQSDYRDRVGRGKTR